MTPEPFYPFDPPHFLQHKHSAGRRDRSAVAAQPVKSDEDYIARCRVCGQAYDLRELDEVLHHGRGPHDPIQVNR